MLSGNKGELDMKLIMGLLFLLILVFAVPAFAQAPAPTHVIIIVQENRSPDALFSADTALVSGGSAAVLGTTQTAYCSNPNTPTFLLQPAPFNACFDPQHGHSLGFEPTFDSGLWDGACTVTATDASCWHGTGPANYTYADNAAFNGNMKILDP
jgi:hypothetical protein